MIVTIAQMFIYQKTFSSTLPLSSLKLSIEFQQYLDAAIRKIAIRKTSGSLKNEKIETHSCPLL